MEASLVDMNEYVRKEHFEYYLKCDLSINVTTNIKVTPMINFIKRNHLRTMPVLVWIISKAVNSIEAFRLTINENRDLCCYNEMSPAYVVLNQKSNAFSCIFTEYSDDFWLFYQRCKEDMLLANTGRLFPQEKSMHNLFSISCMTQVPFTAARIGFCKPPLKPIFLSGQYFEEDGEWFMPLSIQVHHAFCDGYHISLFINKVNELISQISVLEENKHDCGKVCVVF